MGEKLRADAARNRQAILKAAYEQLAEYGVGVPVDRIAKAAGVGPGTLYRHFPNKGELIDAVVDFRIQEIKATADRALDDDPPGSALFAVLDRLARDAHNDQALFDVLSADTQHGPATARATSEFLAVLHTLLDDAQREGTVSDDINAAGLKIVLVGYQAMMRQLVDDPTEQTRLSAFIRRGLSPPN